MPSSETDFLNSALGEIGAARITSIDDGTINANYCLTFWPSLRRSLLRSHFWNFAMARVQLAQVLPSPVYEYAFAYGLPTDLLRIVEFSGTSPLGVAQSFDLEMFGDPRFMANYVIEGRQLLTNSAIALLLYVRDVTDPNVWDALFYDAASTLLAAQLAGAITKDQKLAQTKQMQGERELAEATSVDGQENTERPFVVNDFLWGR